MKRRQRDRTRPSATPPQLGAPSGPPAAGPEPSPPPAAGGPTNVSAGRVAELVGKATAAGATAADVTAARAELARVLATALDLALDAADLDQVMKLSDRLTKLLPASAGGAAPEPPPAGGETDGDSGDGEPTAAERFRALSGELGN